MKKFVDFETNGPLGKVIDQVIGIESDNSSEEAGLILTDSEDKVLRYLQKTEKRVVQICHSGKFPMSHLIEDYPERLRVVDIRSGNNLLVSIIRAITEIIR